MRGKFWVNGRGQGVVWCGVVSRETFWWGGNWRVIEGRRLGSVMVSTSHYKSTGLSLIPDETWGR